MGEELAPFAARRHIMVCSPHCTRDHCIVHREKPDGVDGIHYLQCPCCGSKYDLAGRAFTGPAPHNLMVPEYSFIGSEAIEFLEFVGRFNSSARIPT